MSGHDFAPLFVHYPAVIADMKPTFTSHEFILHLAHQYQDLYVDALASYRTTRRRDTPKPFMVVHGILSKHLVAFSDLVRSRPASEINNDFGKSR